MAADVGGSAGATATAAAAIAASTGAPLRICRAARPDLSAASAATVGEAAEEQRARLVRTCRSL